MATPPSTLIRFSTRSTGEKNTTDSPSGENAGLLTPSMYVRDDCVSDPAIGRASNPSNVRRYNRLLTAKRTFAPFGEIATFTRAVEEKVSPSGSDTEKLVIGRGPD